MGKLKDRLFAVFYPNRCFICDKALQYPDTVCADCGAKIIRYADIRGAVCDVCGLKLADCICRPGRLYEKAVFPLFYTDDTRVSLHKLKFRGRLDKVKPFAKAMYDALNERDALRDIDLITYIPMRKRRERKRGYNQAQLLCEELAALAEIPVKPLLYKYQSAETQHEIGSFLFRSGNALGVYEPLAENLREIEGKRILLVDDILTTGSTLNEAAKTLLIFGSDTVTAAVAAAVPKKSDGKKQPGNRN